jgi:hypothetical protein
MMGGSLAGQGWRLLGILRHPNVLIKGRPEHRRPMAWNSKEGKKGVAEKASNEWQTRKKLQRTVAKVLGVQLHAHVVQRAGAASRSATFSASLRSQRSASMHNIRVATANHTTGARLLAAASLRRAMMRSLAGWCARW